MTRAKRIVKFTVETERTFIFRSRSDRQAAWCAGCGDGLPLRRLFAH